MQTYNTDISSKSLNVINTLKLFFECIEVLWMLGIFLIASILWLYFLLSCFCIHSIKSEMYTKKYSSTVSFFYEGMIYQNWNHGNSCWLLTWIAHKKKNKGKCGSWSAFQNYYFDFDHFVILIFSADSCIKNTIIYRGWSWKICTANPISCLH